MGFFDLIKKLIFTPYIKLGTQEKAEKQKKQVAELQEKKEKEDKNVAEPELKKKAKETETNNAEALYKLGEAYCEGIGVEKDYSKAYEYYKKAAELGSAEAAYKIGWLYQNGCGVRRNDDSAYEWYRKAAKLGNVEAMYMVGEMCYEGKGTKQNYNEAYEWYKNASELGNVKAMYKVGLLYYEGYGVRNDITKAYEWFYKAAELGSAEAAYKLGTLYRFGRGVEKDYDKARKWYQKAVELGSKEAESALKRMEEETTNDKAKVAFERLKKEAEYKKAEVVPKKVEREERYSNDRSIEQQIYPGQKLYHRGNYIRDQESSLGEVIVKRIEKGKYIICDTIKGEKTFRMSDIGKYLYFSKTDVNDVMMIEGKREISEFELRRYIDDREDPIFVIEKAFFDDIKSKLQTEYDSVSIRLKFLRYYFGDSSDSFENPYAEYNKLARKQAELVEALNRPYFARIDLMNYEQKTIYIGDRALSVDKRIVDWREPVCQVYYFGNLALYKKYGVNLIRKFDIYKGNFCGYFDSYVAGKKFGKQNEIIDDFLIKVIKKQRRNSKPYDIVQTIQAGQYEIISEELDKSLIVQGCAGSGKTVVLMHRLSYLLYNNKELSPGKIKIITPNKNLNLELDQLSQKLQLSSIPRYTLSEYCLYLIKKYEEHYGISIPNVKIINYDADLLEEDDSLGVETLQRLKAVDLCSGYKQFEKNQEELTVLCNWARQFVPANKFSTCNDRKQFIDWYNNNFTEALNLLKQIKEILKEDENLEVVSQLRERIKKMNEAKPELSKYIEKVLGELERRKEKSEIACKLIDKLNTIKGLIKSNKIYDNLEILELPSEQEEYLREYNYFETEGKNVEICKDQFGYKIEIIHSPFAKFKQQLKEKKDNYEKLKDVVEKIKEYMEFMKPKESISNAEVENFVNRFNEFASIVNSLHDFVNNKNNRYFSFIWKCYIEQIKKEHNIPLDKSYQFELFALLEVLFSKFGKIPDGDRYLFIDEGQELLEEELELMMKINDNPCINIFGDKAQRTRPLAGRYIFDSFSKDNFKKHELDINYRNCRQITDYINNRCNMNIKSLGIDGIVRVIKFDELSNDGFNKIVSEINGRKVLIVKDEEALEKIKEKINDISLSHANIIFNSRDRFLEDKLNILNIKSSKGLEFQEVIVFDYRLTINELYIACSRALEKLTVIEYK